MKPQPSPRYVYSRDRDGCDDVFDIWDTRSNAVLSSVHFWDSGEGEAFAAEEEAYQIACDLNLHGPRNVRAFDDIA